MFLFYSWDGVFSDPESGIFRYTWSVGSQPGYDDMMAFTETSHVCSQTDEKQPLKLEEGHSYYVSVKVRLSDNPFNLWCRSEHVYVRCDLLVLKSVETQASLGMKKSFVPRLYSTPDKKGHCRDNLGILSSYYTFYVLAFKPSRWRLLVYILCEIRKKILWVFQFPDNYHLEHWVVTPLEEPVWRGIIWLFFLWMKTIIFVLAPLEIWNDY